MAIDVKFQIITPAEASAILAKSNNSNRKLDAKHVMFLSKVMATGQFSPDNGDSIRFDEDGNLLDGQHRLAAIVKSGQSMALMVAHGVPRASFTTIDIGKRRTMADVVHIDLASAETPRGTTSAAMGLHAYERRFEGGIFASTGKGSRVCAPSMKDVVAICRRDGFLDTVTCAYAMSRRMGTASTATLTTAIIACEKNNAPAARSYFAKLESMEGLIVNSPEHTVGRALMVWRTNGSTVQRSFYGQLYAILRGFIASRDGGELRAIRFPLTTDGYIYLPTK